MELVRGWLAEGVPVHCVGVQAHVLATLPTQVVAARLDRLAQLGLPLYITELDVQSYWDSATQRSYWTGTDQEQAEAHER